MLAGNKMENLVIKEYAEKILNEVKRQTENKSLKTVEASVQVVWQESQELNLESNQINLLRTLIDQSISLQLIVDHRKAQLSVNQFTDDEIQKLVNDTLLVAQSTPPDENATLPQEKQTLNFEHKESETAELEQIYNLLDGYLTESKKLYPKVINDGHVKHVRKKSVHAATTGSRFFAEQSYHEGFTMFTAKDGNKSSSLNYCAFVLPEKINGLRLSDVNQNGELLKQISEQTATKKVSEKFEGDVIITPHCLGDFVHYWTELFSSQRLLQKNSPFQNALSEKIASEKFTLSSEPRSSDFPINKFWTGDGLKTENEILIQNGILKNFILNDYAAKKLNKKVSHSSGFWKIKPGETDLSEIIKKTKKGVLLCRYSAGAPAENGDISGVAKNSYYIENGEIQYPIAETMVSGNLIKMLHDIQDVSNQTINNGSSNLPWIRIKGMSVS